MVTEDDDEARAKSYPTFDTIHAKIDNNVYGDTKSNGASQWMHLNNLTGIRLLFADLLEMATIGKHINKRNQLFQPWRLLDMFEKTLWDLAEELATRFKLPALITMHDSRSNDVAVVGSSTAAFASASDVVGVVANDTNESDSDDHDDAHSPVPDNNTFSGSQEAIVHIHANSPRSPYTLKTPLHSLQCITPIVARPHLGSGYFSQQQSGGPRSLSQQSHSYRIDERTPILAQSEL